MYTTKEFTIAIIVTAILFSGFGFLGTSFVKLNTEQDLSQNQTKPGVDTFQAGLDAAYQRLMSRGHAAVVARGYGYRSSKMIAGQVKSIQDNIIELRVNPVSPLADPKLDTRTIKINKKTKIYKYTEKTMEEMDADMRDFEEKMEEFSGNPEGTPPAPPESFGKKEIELSTIEASSNIRVIAGSNIHDVQEFIALEIILQ